MLSSVYYKLPDTFVKKIRDRINERLDLEGEDSTLATAVGGKPSTAIGEYVDSTGVKRSDYIKEAQVPQATYTTDLLSLDDDQ